VDDAISERSPPNRSTSDYGGLGGAGAGDGAGELALGEQGLVSRLRRIEAFAGLQEEQVEDAVAAGGVRLVHLSEGDELVEAGAAADEVYVVVDGCLEATTTTRAAHGARLAELPEGSIVGEIAVLSGGRRNATLRAVTDTEVVGIDGATFRTFLEQDPTMAEELASEARRRLFRTRLARHLAALLPAGPSTPGAAGRGGLDPGRLASQAEPVHLPAGALLFSQGDPADAAYIVVSGRLRVLIEDDESVPLVVAEIGAGQLAGELALLDDAPRGATLVAARDTELARLSRQAFESLVRTEPSPMLEVTRTIVRRSREPMDAFRRAASDGLSIGLLPLSAEVDVTGLVDALSDRLRTHGSVERIDRGEVDRVLATDDIADVQPGAPDALQLERWLAEAEDRADVLLLLADARVSPWSRRCVRQVDHLVLVADADAHPAVTELERLLVQERTLPHQHVSLVLLHPADRDRPRDTAAWLEPRDLDEHHHVRRGNSGDLDRLARHLAGRPVTLVLGGGGAKGFAHLGVVRVLDELGIPIDALASASMGAPLAALVASDVPRDELVPLTAGYYSRVLDYTVPVSSMLAGRRLARRLDEGVGGRAIEDLWLPFLCVSTNLTRSCSVVHRSGDLSIALRASVSIPGVFPPVPFGEDLLVDGGVLNNLPTDLARRWNPTGVVIASDVAPTLGPRAKEAYGLHVSGTEVLAKRLMPGMRAPKVPALMATLMRSLMVSAASARDRGVAAGLADLYLLLELRGVGLLDFEATEAVAQRGYDEALGPITAWASSR
jgi:predicted acylesterase/phospholipase RssA/CRP-like cAMP-binding protein